jgi:hypothetical protein
MLLSFDRLSCLDITTLFCYTNADISANSLTSNWDQVQNGIFHKKDYCAETLIALLLPLKNIIIEMEEI